MRNNVLKAVFHLSPFDPVPDDYSEVHVNAFFRSPIDAKSPFFLTLEFWIETDMGFDTDVLIRDIDLDTIPDMEESIAVLVETSEKVTDGTQYLIWKYMVEHFDINDWREELKELWDRNLDRWDAYMWDCARMRRPDHCQEADDL